MRSESWLPLFPLTSSIIQQRSGHTVDVYANFARGRRGLLTRQIKRNTNEDKMPRFSQEQQQQLRTKQKRRKATTSCRCSKLLQPTALPLPQSTLRVDHSLCIFKFSVSVRVGTLNKTVRVLGASISDQW